MSTYKQIIIKIKAEFQQAAEFLDRSAAKILREFMHDFIAKNKISEVSTSARSTVKNGRRRLVLDVHLLHLRALRFLPRLKLSSNDGFVWKLAWKNASPA